MTGNSRCYRGAKNREGVAYEMKWVWSGVTLMRVTPISCIKRHVLPINSCPLSCRRAWPSCGASRKRRGSWSTCSDASFTFRSARTWCHCLSFRGTWDFTVRTSGPLPTSNENATVDGAGEAGPKVTIKDNRKRPGVLFVATVINISR